MASLDQILDRMRERGAERLDLRIGQVPVVRASGRAVLVQKVPLTEEQVLALAEEMASGDALTRLTRREPVDFIYRGFHVNVTFAPPGIAVVVTPGPGPTHPAPEPIPPLDVVSGLQTANAAETDSPISAPPDSIELDIAPGTGPQASRAPSPVAVGVRAPSIAPSPRPAAPVAAPLPGGFIDDIRSWFETRRARYIGLGAAGALLLLVTGGVLWCNRPVRVPNVVMADASGHAVTFDDMRGARPRLLVVFLLPGCSMSKFAADTQGGIPRPVGAHGVRRAILWYATAGRGLRQEHRSPIPGLWPPRQHGPLPLAGTHEQGRNLRLARPRHLRRHHVRARRPQPYPLQARERGRKKTARETLLARLIAP